jgi:hypothetical protein
LLGAPLPPAPPHWKRPNGSLKDESANDEVRNEVRNEVRKAETSNDERHGELVERTI